MASRLIEDVTPAERRAATAVAEYEVENLKAGREVYIKRGQLFFRSTQAAALHHLSVAPVVPPSGVTAPALRPAVARPSSSASIAGGLDSLE
mmetsp:Transcript_132367/g.423588  ORF Transcript_132367/g.423588 Transcript_132367/m.423588 type:complete len:92 (-) Transcript_132367:19-294(-)